MDNPQHDPGSVYSYPRYYAIGYQWNTAAECQFLEACLAKYAAPSKSKNAPRRLLDIGCGAGRHMLEMAKRGFEATGFDVRPEMVRYVEAEAKKSTLPVRVSEGDLRDMRLEGTYDLAICLMDTFRFLLTNEQIIRHLKTVGEHLRPGGLYVTDFWIPLRYDQIANEIYQWEQSEDDTTVRVFYLQHPETIDPITQTFEDELVFSVDDGGSTQEIRGTRTRTRLILPQEFRALVEASQLFDVAGGFADFDLAKPLEPDFLTWRMVTVLKRRG